MADASYVQTSFLGGEISKWAQGEFDDPIYKKSLNKASNVLLVDEGAAPRRPGTKFLGTTRNGGAGRVMPFDFTEDQPYNMELTDGFLRFWNAEELVTTNDSQMILSVSQASPAVFSLSAAVTWATGDEAYFTFNSPFQAVLGAVLLNRQFILTMVSSTKFTIKDAVTGVAINATDLNTSVVNISTGPLGNGPISNLSIGGSVSATTVLVNLSATVNHITQIATRYTVAGNDWHTLRSVQGLTNNGPPLAMLLHTSVAPQALQVVVPPSASQFASFSFGSAQFRDGPYLDPPANAIATPSAKSGLIQLVVGYTAWSSTTVYGIGVPVTYSGQDYVSLKNGNVNNTPNTSTANWRALPLGVSISPQGFVSTDIGRMIRLFSAPLDWSSATTYAAGNTVGYNGAYFTSLINSNTNNQPDISTTDWVLNTSAAIYTWGTITAVASANTVSVQIYGGNLLYTTPCPSFRIGAWSDTTGWPTCGCYQGGRFWFAGAIPNRVDSSQPNDPFNMAPTGVDGTVTNASAIAYIFNSNSVDKILWMEPQSQGILVGTKKGEYLLNSGSSGGPITPTSISESPATKYGTADVLPVKTGLTMCFVQRYKRRLLEYLADVFSNRFYGPDLTTNARHIGARGFAELAYQAEPAPIVWARMDDGSLAGTTYRRISLFSNQKPEFNAWHQQPLGSNRLVESICVGPSTDGVLDTLAMVTNDPSTNVRFVESLTTLLDENDPLTSSWFLDAAVVPQAATCLTVNGVNVVRFFGLSHLANKTVSVFAAAIDCGDIAVQPGGYLDVPIGTLDSISGYAFDFPQFDILQPKSSSFAALSVAVVNQGETFNIPCVIGYNYKTEGQICSPMIQADTGAKNGPGFAKKRKTTWYGINLIESLGVRVGTNFDKTVPVPTTSPSGRLLPYLSAFSGIKRETLPDDMGFDSMLCWQTTRPYPATVTALGGFINTEDV